MIYYFTGTGNDLYIARRLAEALGEEICSIPQVFDVLGSNGNRMLNKPRVSCKDEVIGIVFPTYGLNPARAARRFIANSDLHAQYGFLIATYGNTDGGVAEWAAEFANNNGFPVSYSNSILMVDNWLPSFDIEVQMSMKKDVEGQLNAIVHDLLARKHYVRQASIENRMVHQQMLQQGEMQLPPAAATFTINDDCIGCGTCAKVCPSATVVMQNGYPIYKNRQCAECFACINLCPTKAIGFATFPDANRNARYRNPNVSIADIIAANNQNTD